MNRRQISRITRLLIFIPVLVLGFFAPLSAQASPLLVNGDFSSSGGGWDGASFNGQGNDACAGGQPNIGTWESNRLSFSYIESTVIQRVIIPTPSTVSFDWSSINRSDVPQATARVSLSDSDQEVATAWFESGTSLMSTGIGPVTTTINNEVVTISISGKDNRGWAGCYGTQFTTSALNISPLATTTTTTIPITNSQYTLGEDMVWGVANEGWNMSLSAPNGGIFSRVVFASYGNPSGSDGEFAQQWCHARNSIQKVSEVFLGNSNGTIGASNGVFGDPCGGTYKRLYVVLQYSGGTTTTTETPTTTTEPTTTTTIIPTTTTEAPVETSTSTSNPKTVESSTSVPQYAAPKVEVTIPPQTTIAPEPIVQKVDISNKEALTEAVSSIFTDVATASELTDKVDGLLENANSPEELASVLDAVLSSAESPEQLSAVLDAVFDDPLSNEEFAAVISEVVQEDITVEELAAVLDSIDAESVTSEQVSELVDAILETTIDEEQAAELATSAKVLESIDGAAAAEIFAVVEINAVTAEQAQEIVNAVQEAPKEVRESFEEEINVFSGPVDTYVGLGSNIPVKTRRVIIAIAAATAAIPAVPTGRKI